MSKASTVRPINVHGTMTPKVKADLKKKCIQKIIIFSKVVPKHILCGNTIKKVLVLLLNIDFSCKVFNLGKQNYKARQMFDKLKSPNQ